MSFSIIHRCLGFLGVLGLLVFGILFLEILWICRENRLADEISYQNSIQRQENERRRAEIKGLEASQSKISAMFVRLNDAVFDPRVTETSRVQSAGRFRSHPVERDQRPAVIQMLGEAGVVVQPGRTLAGETSGVYEAGSSRLELQRLIPLLAEQENSNAFLYFDRVFLNRPAATPPFSLEPTYLDARFSIRIFTNK